MSINTFTPVLELSSLSTIAKWPAEQRSDLMITFRASCSITADWMSSLFHTASKAASRVGTWGRQHQAVCILKLREEPVNTDQSQRSRFCRLRLQESSAWRWPIRLWCRCSCRWTLSPGSREPTVSELRRSLQNRGLALSRDDTTTEVQTARRIRTTDQRLRKQPGSDTHRTLKPGGQPDSARHWNCLCGSGNDRDRTSDHNSATHCPC